MKKALLLLFLLVAVSLSAQVQPGMQLPYNICDDASNDGFAVFDLTSTIPSILSGVDASVHEVHFYPSETDAVNIINEITTPNAYTNISQGIQILGIRIINTSTNEIVFSGMNLIVNPLPYAIMSGNSTVCQNSVSPVITIIGAGGTAPYTFTYSNSGGVISTISTNVGSNSVILLASSAIPGTSVYSLVSVQSGEGCSQNQSGSVIITVSPLPTANPASLQFCDLMELAIYNLTDANNLITTDPTAIVTYYETLTNAQAGANPVGPTYFPNEGTQVLYARVTNQMTGCFSITTLTLNTHNCGSLCAPPVNLVATNVTDTSFTLNWTNTNGSMGYIFNRVSIVPQGQAPSVNNSFIVNAPQNIYTFVGLSTNACYSVYVKKYCDTSVSGAWSAPLNICMPNCADSGACSQALVLNAFLDSNNNGVKDTGEVNFNNGNFVYQINDSGINQYGTNNNGSYYIFDANPSNSYDISFGVNPDLSPYYTSSVTYNNVTLPSGSGTSYLYFPVVNIQPYADAQVNLYPSGQPRPGFVYYNTIYYKNNGLEPINGTLTFTKHPTVSIASISQTGTTATSTGFTYDFINLAPFEVRSITVGILVPTIPTVNLGDLVTNSVSIQIDNDSNLSNNNSSLTQTIVGSYDPNDMTESHGGKIVHSTFTANDYLYYTIQFENTGTANAEFIRVEDLLDTQLDETTFEMLSASHNVDTKREGNQLTWHFYDINLPPTSANPSGSHGTISFRIKPKAGYAIGDLIPNTASIYFDYNPPIVTNTFNTEFVNALSNATFDANTISLYPNPANENVTITNSNSEERIAKVSIYDITGKRIYTLDDNTLSAISIDVSHFAKGLYLVELTSDNNTKTTKKLLLK